MLYFRKSVYFFLTNRRERHASRTKLTLDPWLHIWQSRICIYMFKIDFNILRRDLNYFKKRKSSLVSLKNTKIYALTLKFSTFLLLISVCPHLR